MSSPSITFGALKAELRAELFPTGEPYNLRVAHDKMFAEAIYDLQQKVDCFQINNTQVVPFCATKFQCGMTVFTAPRGRIWRVSTVDRLNPATGEEGGNEPIQWCSEIIYKQVDYCRLEKFLDKQLGCSCSMWSQVPPPYCTKTPSPRFTRFPVPDNSAYADFPELPLGFIYPTPTTDVSCGRAKTGVWAQHSGRIYLAPWIQSTELILVEWDGIKRDWTDDDLLDDDAQLKKAIKMYVQAQRARDYDCDQQKYLQYRAEYEDVRSWLWWECEQETKLKNCEPRKSRWSEVTLEDQAPLPLPTTTSTTTNTLWRCSSGDCVQGNGTLDTLFDCRLTGCEMPPECPPVPTSCPEGWVIAYDDNECLICCDVSGFDADKVGFLQSLWELLLCRPAPCEALYAWAAFWQTSPDTTEEQIQSAWLLSDDYQNPLVAGKGCGDPPPPTGRCCLPFDHCVSGVTQVQCDNMGGNWAEGETCVSSPCHADPPPPSRFDCVDGRCLPYSDGEFATLSECLASDACGPPYSCVDGNCEHDPEGPHNTLEECEADPPCTTSTTTCGWLDSDVVPEIEGCSPAPCKTVQKDDRGCWVCCEIPNCNETLAQCVIDAYQSILCRAPDCSGLRYWHGKAIQYGWNCDTLTMAIQRGAAAELSLNLGCGVCCYPDGTCHEVRRDVCFMAGGVFYQDGECGVPPVTCGDTPTGSCCLPDGTCQSGRTQAQCNAVSGTWTQGGSCEPNPCPQPPTGSCCLANGDCIQTSEANCTLAGGVWTQGQSCEPNPCVGSCCHYNVSTGQWECTEGLTLSECDALSGTWGGVNAVCPSDPPVDCLVSCALEADCPDPIDPPTLTFSGLGYTLQTDPGTPLVSSGGGVAIAVGFNQWNDAAMAFNEVGSTPPERVGEWSLSCSDGVWLLYIGVRAGGAGSNRGFHLTKAIVSGSDRCDPRGTYRNPTTYTDGSGFSDTDFSTLSVVIS